MPATVCLSHGGTTVYPDAAPTRKLLVGTVNGVAILEKDTPERWRVSAQQLEGKHISVLLSEPASGAIFAGVHKGGIFVSLDGGATWEQRDQGLSQNNVYSMCSARGGGTTRIYVGTEPAHLFVSEDLGKSWKELPALRNVESVRDWTFPAPPNVAHLKNIVIDYSEPRRIYALIEQGCLLRSDDAGQSWTELYGIDEDVHRLALDPKHPGTLYLATGNGLYKSLNRGERWKHITPRTMRIGYPDPLIVHPSEDGLIFIAGAHHGPEVWHSTKTADSAIARSRDGGLTWEVLKDGLPEHVHGNIGAMAIAVSSGGFELYACGTDGEIFASTDGGDHWATIASGLAPLSKGGHHMVLKVRPQAAMAGSNT